MCWKHFLKGVGQECRQRLFSLFHSLLNPGVSGLRLGLQSLSRSPSSLVCPSIDSSLTGGDNEAHAGLDESVRNDSLPVPPVPADELFPEPKSKPLNLENFYQSSRFTRFPRKSSFKILTWSKPKPKHFGGAKAEGRERFDGNGFTKAPPLPNGLEFADETAGFKCWWRKCGWKPCKRWVP